ncbi:hypothetical protein BC940DRAFT_229939 [Gongronella butleri]|nr:hypothetical protein BC940DRAFT_229939 [Gongronella butleri]
MLVFKAGLFACAALFLGVDAMYSSRDQVVELTSANFKKEVLDNDKLVAVEFYAPWCGHCQNLAPEWKKAAGNLKGLVTVAAVNCDEDANKPLCGEYGIQGFPTIKVFRPRVNKQGKRVKTPTDYQGPRTAKPIVDQLLSMQPSNVRFVKADGSAVSSKKSISIDDFLAKNNETLPKALLFTDKSSTAPLYKALSVDIDSKRLLTGEVKKSEKAVLEQFGVTSFPTLMVLVPGQQDPVVYQGKLKYDLLHDFLSEYALPGAEKPKPKAKKQRKKKMQELTSTAQLTALCPSTENVICALALVAEGDEAEGVDLMKKLNDNASTSPLFRFGWVRSSQARELMNKLDLVDDFPGLVIVHSSKQLYRPFIGAWDEQSVSRWLSQIASGRLSAYPYSGELAILSSEEPRQERVRDEL